MSASRPNDPPTWLTAVALLGAVALAWAVDRPQRVRAASAPMRAGALPHRAVARMPASTASGSGADRPSVLRRPWAWWKRVLFNTYTEIQNDRVLAVAAGVVFYALLAIFPAITAFVSLYGLVASPETVKDHIALSSYVLPPGGVEIVQEQINRIVEKGGGRLSLGFVAGLAVAIWSANAGIKAIMDALNVVADEKEKRGFFRLNFVSLCLTVGAILFLLLAIGGVVALPLVMAAFGMNSVTDTLTALLRWPLLLVAIMTGLAVLYRFGPSRRHPRWRWISPGIVFATLAWIAVSALLSFYLSSFADYGATYGSLGAAIGLMMWMWLSTTVVLIGAELDSEIDKLR